MIKDVLFKLRMDRGLSQQAVADGAGMVRESYTRYENGSRIPGAEQIIRLADFYGVSADYILERTDIPDMYRRTIEVDGEQGELLNAKKDLPPEEQVSAEVQKAIRAKRTVQVDPSALPANREELTQFVLELVEKALGNVKLNGDPE